MMSADKQCVYFNFAPNNVCCLCMQFHIVANFKMCEALHTEAIKLPHASLN